MAREHQIAISIFDINSRTRAAAFISLGCLFAVLMLIANTQAQTFTVLHTFTAGGDGHNPTAGLTLRGSGPVYGVATYNASGDGGGAFKVAQGGSGWVLYTLFNHTGSGNSKLVIGPDGNL